MGSSWKPRFHELKHESKMRLFQTDSHTSRRQGYEDGKVRRKKGLDVRDTGINRQRKPSRHTTREGDRSRKSLRKREVVPLLQQLPVMRLREAKNSYPETPRDQRGPIAMM